MISNRDRLTRCTWDAKSFGPEEDRPRRIILSTFPLVPTEADYGSSNVTSKFSHKFDLILSFAFWKSERNRTNLGWNSPVHFVVEQRKSLKSLIQIEINLGLCWSLNYENCCNFASLIISIKWMTRNHKLYAFNYTKAEEFLSLDNAIQKNTGNCVLIKFRVYWTENSYLLFSRSPLFSRNNPLGFKLLGCGCKIHAPIHTVM